MSYHFIQTLFKQPLITLSSNSMNAHRKFLGGFSPQDEHTSNCYTALKRNTNPRGDWTLAPSPPSLLAGLRRIIYDVLPFTEAQNKRDNKNLIVDFQSHVPNAPFLPQVARILYFVTIIGS